MSGHVQTCQNMFEHVHFVVGMCAMYSYLVFFKFILEYTT